MIDIHCHILPNVDDGAKSLDESLEMARIAYEDGIRTIINTSHYHPDFEYVVGKDLEKSLEEFNKVLKENNINIEVLLGNEIYYTKDILENIDNEEFYTLNNSRYILVEFSTSLFPSKLADIVYELKLRGYAPILAHVERYKEVQENINIIKDAVQEGALIQVNASSIGSKISKTLNKTTDILLNSNLVHFIASDAHSSSRRSPLLKSAFDIVSKKYGKDKATELFILNPTKVINDEEIFVDRSNIKIKNKKKFLFKWRLF